MLYKDHANRKNNQSNLGVLKSSNLCTEIMQFTDKNQIATCNLSSVSLSTFYDVKTKNVDYEKLHDVTRFIVGNLDNIIDRN